MVKESWFHGFVLAEDADTRSKYLESGYFFVRFSNSDNKGACVLHTHDQTPFLVAHDPEGYHISGSKIKHPTLPDLVAHFKKRLKYPARAPFTPYTAEWDK